MTVEDDEDKSGNTDYIFHLETMIAEARETITRQAAEIARLSALLEDDAKPAPGSWEDQCSRADWRRDQEV